MDIAEVIGTIVAFFIAGVGVVIVTLVPVMIIVAIVRATDTPAARTRRAHRAAEVQRARAQMWHRRGSSSNSWSYADSGFSSGYSGGWFGGDSGSSSSCDSGSSSSSSCGGGSSSSCGGGSSC